MRSGYDARVDELKTAMELAEVEIVVIARRYECEDIVDVSAKVDFVDTV